MSIVVRCQDCATVCRNAARWRVLDGVAESFYCDEHTPWRDASVSMPRLQSGPVMCPVSDERKDEKP